MKFDDLSCKVEIERTSSLQAPSPPYAKVPVAAPAPAKLPAKPPTPSPPSKATPPPAKPPTPTPLPPVKSKAGSHLPLSCYVFFFFVSCPLSLRHFIKRFGGCLCRLHPTLRPEVQAPLQEEGVHEGVHDVLRPMQVRASGYVREPRDVREVLHRHDHPRQQGQVPVKCSTLFLTDIADSFSIMKFRKQRWWGKPMVFPRRIC